MALEMKTGEVAEVKIPKNWTKKEAVSSPIREASEDSAFSMFVHRPDKLLEASRKSHLGIHERFNVSEAAYNLVSPASRKYRGQGLFTEMYRKMNLLLKQKGYRLTLRLSSQTNSLEELRKTMDFMNSTQIPEGISALLLVKTVIFFFQMQIHHSTEPSWFVRCRNCKVFSRLDISYYLFFKLRAINQSMNINKP
jgi:hypothetical protein